MPTYSYGIGKKFSNSQKTIQQSQQELFGRVVRVVLDKNSPDYEIFGHSGAIGGIRYRIIGKDRSEERIEDLPFAYPLEVSKKEFPVIGEIVKISKGPSENNLSENIGNVKTYYSGIVNLFNEVNNNRYPDEFQVDLNSYEDKEAPEVTGIFQLQPEPGDTIFQGRLGSTLRLGGYLRPTSTLSDQTNLKDPYAILKVGKGKADLVSLTSTEDIDSDDASIYLTSNHRLPFTQTRPLDSTYYQPPKHFNTYKGKQLAFNSDRIVLNAKVDHILFSANKSIGGAGESINFEGKEYVGLESKKIFLGGKSLKSKNPQPVVLGLENEKFLKGLLTGLETLSNTLSSLSPSPAAATVQLITAGSILRSYITQLRATLPTLKSKKVFTD